MVFKPVVSMPERRDNRTEFVTEGLVLVAHAAVPPHPECIDWFALSQDGEYSPKISAVSFHL
jgi:hypothetical protein